MAFAHGRTSRLYIKGFDASGYAKELGQDITVDKAETSNLLSLGKEYIPGMQDITDMLEGFFDGNVPLDTATFSYWMDTITGTITEYLYLPQGDGIGNFGYGIQGLLTKNSIKTTTTEAGQVSLELQGNVGMERVVIAHAKGAEIVTANGAMAHDNAAGTTNGGVGYLHVFAVSGTSTPTLTGKIQHSTDNSTYNDLITFDPVTAAGTSQRKTVAGTVNRYIRGQWTITGTTPSFTFNSSFARK